MRHALYAFYKLSSPLMVHPQCILRLLEMSQILLPSYGRMKVASLEVLYPMIDLLRQSLPPLRIRGGKEELRSCSLHDS
jgi:hypothetical protein